MSTKYTEINVLKIYNQFFKSFWYLHILITQNHPNYFPQGELWVASGCTSNMKSLVLTALLHLCPQFSAIFGNAKSAVGLCVVGKLLGHAAAVKGARQFWAPLTPWKRFFSLQSREVFVKKITYLHFPGSMVIFQVGTKITDSKYIIKALFLNKFYSQCNVIINSLPTFFTNIESRHHAARFVVASICR